MSLAVDGVPLEDLLAESAWLRRLARRLVAGESAAEELVQETWLAILRHPPRSGRPLRPWLGSVMRKLASNLKRRMSVRREHDANDRLSDVELDPARLAEAVDAQRLLAEAVLRLDEPLRVCVVLRYYRELDSATIARQLGVPSGTVRWRLSCAVGRLRADLDKRAGSRRHWCNAFAALLPSNSSLDGANPRATDGIRCRPQHSGAGLAAVVAIAAGLGTWGLIEGRASFSRRTAAADRSARLTRWGGPGDYLQDQFVVDVSQPEGTIEVSREALVPPSIPATAEHGMAGSQQEPSPLPATVLGAGVLDPSENGLRAIAIGADGCLLAFEYEQDGRCLAFDVSGHLRGISDPVGYCSEAISLNGHLYLLMPEGGLVKFDEVSLSIRARASIPDQHGAWLANALCTVAGRIVAGSGDDGTLTLYSQDLKQLGAWQLFPTQFLVAMDADEEHVFAALQEPDQITVQALRLGVDETSTPVPFEAGLAIRGQLVDLCALPKLGVLIATEHGELLHYAFEPSSAEGSQWMLRGRTDLSTEPWFGEAGDLGRIAYSHERQTLYFTCNDYRRPIVAIPYSAADACRMMTR